MLTKIENPEIKTVREFRNQYADKWFRYVIVEDEEACLDKQPDEELAIVLYFSDSREELLKIPDDKLFYDKFIWGGNYWGINVNPEPGIQIGGIEVEWPMDFN